MSTEEEDYYADEEWFAWTLTDVVFKMVSGTISALSSALILFIIYRSPVKLNSTYHRIMTLLSSCDICFSLPLALATIPIPKSLVPYKGPTLGTDGTCLAQGILLQFGAGAIHDTTLCLAGYYVCTALRVSHWKITRIYEPIFYTYIIGINLVTTVLTATNGYINIRHWSAHCGITPIPSYCWYEESWMEMDDAMAVANNEVDLSKCVWPEEPHFVLTGYKIWRYYILVSWVLLVLAMVVVVFVVYRNERMTIQELLAKQQQQENDVNNAIDMNMEEENSNDENTASPGDGDGDGGDRRLTLEVTPLIIRQAIMYILAFFVTWVVSIIRQLASAPKIYDILDSFLLPLGGFWNMLIFVHIKILHVRSSNVGIDSNFKAFMVLIKEPETIPEMVLSGMENVQILDQSFEVADPGNGHDDGGDDDEEDGLSEEPSRFTSNPSAYDDLSMETPTHASHGLSGASNLDTDTNDAHQRTYYMCQNVETPRINTASGTTHDSSTIDVRDSSGRNKAIESSSKGSSSRDSNTSDASAKTGTIVNNDTKEVYKYYSEIATKFKTKVGLMAQQNSSNSDISSPYSSVVDDLSSIGLSTGMGAPSYGGLSNEMPAINEDDDNDENEDKK